MSRSQGPRQGPLAPDAGREVGPGAVAAPEAGRGRAAPALPPRGPHPLWAPEPRGWSSRGCARAGATSPVSARHRGPRGRGTPRACPPAAAAAFSLLSPAPVSPLAFKASGCSPDCRGGRQREREHLRIQSWHWTAFSPPR